MTAAHPTSIWLPLLGLAMAVRLSQMTLDRLNGRLPDEP